jgi:hypothetical protein
LLAFFGDVLFGPGDRVLSRVGADVYRQFAGWRAFGFEEWRSGDFPFWNPLVYGGLPYFAGFQSALLYPPNWLFLAMPVPRAIDAALALHAWWLATGVFVWLRRGGLHPAAAGFSGLLVVFGGPHFLHLYAGHLTNLCVMAWAPWLFLAIEAWRDDGRPRWIAAGGVVVAMEIFAGHPQYVYYSGVAGALVAAASAARRGATSRGAFAGGVVAMFALGAALGAVQLLPGLAALRESVRAGGTDAAFAGSYSLPPENLVTSVVPGFFGDDLHRPYWGRWFLWETCTFVGVCAAVLGVAGVWAAEDRAAARGDTIVVAALLALALGAYTPLFPAMLRAAPGYALFRGPSKFAFFAAVVAARLVARGAHATLRGALPRLGRRGGIAALAPVALLAAGGALLTGDAPDGGPAAWRRWRADLFASRQVTHLSRSQYFDPDFSRRAALDAGRGLVAAAGLGGVAVALAAASRQRRAAAWALLALGSFELVRFAGGLRTTFRWEELTCPETLEYRRAHPGDFRVLDRARANGGLLSGLPDVWGDDPGVLRRYAEFVFATQGRPPDAASQTATLRGAHARWDLLRFRAAFTAAGAQDADVQEIDLHPLRRFEVVPRWEVIEGRDGILARVLAPGFDPRRVVVLETPPRGVAADSSEVGGSWTILAQSVDDVTVEVNAPCGGILLMTDPYCRGWRAEAAEPAGRSGRYDVMPADWAFRAVPLAPGTHRLRIFYRPPLLVAGAVASGAAWAALLGLLLVPAVRRRLGFRGRR